MSGEGSQGPAPGSVGVVRVVIYLKQLRTPADTHRHHEAGAARGAAGGGAGDGGGG